MVLRCYENWGFWKRVVLEFHPICTQLVEGHQSVIYDSPIYISLLKIKIVLSPVSGLLYDVAACTIGTVFMVSYASFHGVTSHYLPINSW